MASPLMILDQLGCTRGTRTLFSGLSLAVRPGEAWLLTGPNGAGKSSLLRQMAGLLQVSAGRIERPARLAWLGHDNALKGDQSLAAQLSWWAKLDGTSRTLDEALALFDLAALADVPVRIFSSGQKRRAALARLWLADAPLWLLDEPSVGLDAANVARLADVMAAHRAVGGAIVAATHVPLGLDDAQAIKLGGSNVA